MGTGTRSSHFRSSDAARRAGGQTQRPKEVGVSSIAMLTVAIGMLGTVCVAGVVILTLPHCPGTEQITITQVTSGATSSQVIFVLANSGSSRVAIVQALVAGAGITGQASVNINTNNVVPPGSTLSLTTTFPGVTFHSGTRYDFTLVSASACGKFPTAWIPY